MARANVLPARTNHSRASTDLRNEPQRTQPSSSLHLMPRLWGNRDLPLPIPGKKRGDGAIVAALEAAVVASRRGSKWFVRPGAIVSLHRHPRDQAKLGDGKGSGNIGRCCGSSTIVRAAGAGTSTAFRGRSPADRLVRSSRGLCCGNWPAWWGSPADGVRGTGPACARAKVRPGAQTAPFRSHRHDEVATTGLPVDERALAVEPQQVVLG